MNLNDPNVSLLERAAEQLGDTLLGQLVFVGGAVAGLLISDPAMPDIRPTQDVDVICQVISRADYHQLGMQLRQRGFQEDNRPGAPLCRWCIEDLILDLMPTQGNILGFPIAGIPWPWRPASFRGCRAAARFGSLQHRSLLPPSLRLFEDVAMEIIFLATIWKT